MLPTCRGMTHGTTYRDLRNDIKEMLASMVLVLGSLVPVSWLFKAMCLLTRPMRAVMRASDVGGWLM